MRRKDCGEQSHFEPEHTHILNITTFMAEVTPHLGDAMCSSVTKQTRK